MWSSAENRSIENDLDLGSGENQKGSEIRMNLQVFKCVTDWLEC